MEHPLVSGKKPTVVVIGAGYAGVTCAVRLAKSLRDAVNVVVINESDSFCERIRLHQMISGQVLKSRALRPLLARSGVGFAQGKVTELDTRHRRVSIGDGRSFSYDHLVLALGSRPARTISGSQEYAASLAANDAAEVARRVRQVASRSGQVLVVGGGLTAVETASELQETHPSLKVHLAAASGVLGGWPEPAREYARSALISLGVTLHEDMYVRTLTRSAAQISAGTVPYDLCIDTTGFGFSDLPTRGGLDVNPLGQVLVDPWLRSVSNPEIYAVGDIASPVAAPGDPLPMGCKSAIPLGAHAADNIAAKLKGEAETAFDFALPFFCVSLGRHKGLVQWPEQNGKQGRLLTGRLAAVMKELVSRSTYWVLAWEARGWRLAWWAKTGRAPGVPQPTHRTS